MTAIKNSWSLRSRPNKSPNGNVEPPVPPRSFSDPNFILSSGQSASASIPATAAGSLSSSFRVDHRPAFVKQFAISVRFGAFPYVSSLVHRCRNPVEIRSIDSKSEAVRSAKTSNNVQNASKSIQSAVPQAVPSAHCSALSRALPYVSGAPGFSRIPILSWVAAYKNTRPETGKCRFVRKMNPTN